MTKVLLLFLALNCYANSFSLDFFDDRLGSGQQERFQSFFNEIEENVPQLFKNNIRYPINVVFATFDYNKIKLNCKMREFQNYARLTNSGTIEVNDKLILPILNQHMDRAEDNNCTYREALSEGIKRALIGHLYQKFRTDINNLKESP